MMDFASNAVADFSNLTTHFIHPLTGYAHSCSCLLCAAHEQEQQKPIVSPHLALRPLATPSDLDLVKTGSQAIRQLIVLSAPETGCVALRGFVTELKTQLNYTVSFGLPKIDANIPYHVLVFVLCTKLDDTSAERWFRDVISKHAKRAVVLCHGEDSKQFYFTQEQSAKLTLLAYHDLNVVLNALVHGMMVTKQRLMAKDLLKFIPQSALYQTNTQQPGMCLFL
jgi:hypothetical protein